MEIMIFILQCLVILLIFAVYDKVSNKNNIIQQNSKEIDIFTNGVKQGWLHVNISLFKMWNDLDILDYDTMREKLQENLQLIANDEQAMKTWAEKFKTYVEEK